ncbi:helix-turn-helix transcriptional regulator [Bdellovibrio sp. 22V]|uniref:helix-turn-helix domain-containing protein n=1 Tax=Bdellovibrio TaxID=958 RepID=UPI002543D479|nr:helix-turn-helix transcriptional regulator [Bdellovibrio sp. 22V]WII73570.1 helix-turn-helix transcriptional regulator [Bdellovibrio sp. 22V]
MQSRLFKKELGIYLKKKREHVGLSRRDLGLILGYSGSQYVHNWESGIALPPIMKIKILAKHLNVPAEEVFSRVEQIVVLEAAESLRRRFKMEA